MAAEATIAPSGDALRGTLHILVAFDWGEAVDLEHVRRLVPAAVHALQRRRRTPSSFTYHPAPLHFELPAVALELAELGSVRAATGVTMFDFAAVSVAVRVPFHLEPERLCALAG